MNITSVTFVVPCEGVDNIPVTVYSPDTTMPLPLMLIQHGPEYRDRAGIIGYWQERIDSGLPLCRIALMHPTNPDRDAWLTAPDAFEYAVVMRVLPAIRRRFATIGKVVLVGGSIGALMALSCAVHFPKAFGGLFLQSGSFFCPMGGDDASYYPQIQEMVARLHNIVGARHHLHIGMTCGAEPNLANNRLMHDALEAQGHKVFMVPVGTTHDYESWGKCLHPYLTVLARTCWA